MGDDKEDIAKLKGELLDLKAEIKIAKTTLKASVSILAAVLFIFFGVTYANMGGMAKEAVKALLNAEVTAEAAQKAQDAATQSMATSAKAADDVKKRSEETLALFQSASDRVTTELPNITGLIGRLQQYDQTAQERLRHIPDLKNLIRAGIAKDGDVIRVPSGKVKDWSITVSPRYIGFDEGEEIGGADTALLSAVYSVKPTKSYDGWIVTAVSRHKFGASVKENRGQVYFLMTAKVQ